MFSQIQTELNTRAHFHCLTKDICHNDSLVKMQVQHSRLDLILYALSQGKDLKNAERTFDDFINTQSIQKKIEFAKSKNSHQSQDQGILNRQKLSILFAHLSAFNYQFGDLVIEPIAINDLISKLKTINYTNTGQISDYLNALLNHWIPNSEEMSLETFMGHIKTQFHSNGTNFYCYLRENFLNDLKPECIKQAEPSLYYFMPEVFCQQHINSCAISTTMTMLKKIVSNFQQMQGIIFAQDNMPEVVINAQKRMKELDSQFTAYLNDPASFKPNTIKQLHKDYHEQIELIQTEMESVLAKAVDPNNELYKKETKNHTLATLYHLVKKQIIPEGFDLQISKIISLLSKKVSDFQFINVRNHLEKVDKEDIVKGLHNKKANTKQKSQLKDALKKLFLFGKTKAYTENVVCGHSLVMDIDRQGNLNIIEHKNTKPEITTISNIKIGSPDINRDFKEEQISNSIQTTLKRLFDERNNIIKIKRGVPRNSNVFSEISRFLEEKDAEIRDLLTIEKHLQDHKELLGTQSPRKKMFQFKQSIKQLGPKDSFQQPDISNDDAQNLSMS